MSTGFVSLSPGVINLFNPSVGITSRDLLKEAGVGCPKLTYCALQVLDKTLHIADYNLAIHLCFDERFVGLVKLSLKTGHLDEELLPLGFKFCFEILKLIACHASYGLVVREFNLHGFNHLFLCSPRLLQIPLGLFELLLKKLDVLKRNRFILIGLLSSMFTRQAGRTGATTTGTSAGVAFRLSSE